MKRTIFTIKPSKRLRKKLQTNVIKNLITDFAGDVVIFAPHQDDELLGCGGLIINKVKAGATVTVVFVCDGRKSHAPYIDEERLVELRKAEAVAALDHLGVPADAVRFLGYRDTELSRHRDDAVDAVAKIIMECTPTAVFAPYSRDVHPDHEICNAVVRAGIKQSAQETVLFEYPVWYWSHWPWISLPISLSKPGIKEIQKSFKSGLGNEAITTFTCGIKISDVVALKRRALDCYKTQVSRYIPDVGWPILSDVSNGEWLSCFFNDYEVFKKIERNQL